MPYKTALHNLYWGDKCATSKLQSKGPAKNMELSVMWGKRGYYVIFSDQLELLQGGMQVHCQKHGDIF